MYFIYGHTIDTQKIYFVFEHLPYTQKYTVCVNIYFICEKILYVQTHAKTQTIVKKFLQILRNIT